MQLPTPPVDYAHDTWLQLTKDKEKIQYEDAKLLPMNGCKALNRMQTGMP